MYRKAGKSTVNKPYWFEAKANEREVCLQCFLFFTSSNKGLPFLLSGVITSQQFRLKKCQNKTTYFIQIGKIWILNRFDKLLIELIEDSLYFINTLRARQYSLRKKNKSSLQTAINLENYNYKWEITSSRVLTKRSFTTFCFSSSSPIMINRGIDRFSQ